MFNPVKRIMSDKYSFNKKTIIGSRCDYCGDELWHSGDTYDNSEENYVYHNGHYWCKWCFSNIKKKERYEVFKK